MEEIKKKARNKGGKVLAHIRRKAALKRLEEHYEAFKKAGKDKEAYTTHGGTRICPGRSFNDECHRLATEIANLKRNL